MLRSLAGPAQELRDEAALCSQLTVLRLDNLPNTRALLWTGRAMVDLFLRASARWLTWSLRTLMPRRSSRRTAQFDALRLRLIKLAVRVVKLKAQVKLHLPSSAEQPR